MNEEEFPSLGQSDTQASKLAVPLQSVGFSTSNANAVIVSVATGTQSWAECLNTEHSTSFQSNILMMEHTPQVHLIFVNYKKVSSEGYKTP